MHSKTPWAGVAALLLMIVLLACLLFNFPAAFIGLVLLGLLFGSLIALFSPGRRPR